MNKKNLLIITCFIFLMGIHGLNAQKHEDFSITKQIKTTPVKNQQRTGTCWSYSTISFIETEALRMGKKEFDLAEMYIARLAYEKKANLYVRFHGKANFEEGGQAHDVMHAIRKGGLLPQSQYEALNYGTDKHIHREMVNMIKGMLKGVIENSQKKLTPKWFEAVKSVLDVYLGKVPEKFEYEGKETIPLDYAKNSVGVNPDDYIELTSYNHHPYYEMFDLEVPDNWSHDLYYNLPIDELTEVMVYAINNGYSVCWDGDVSEKTYDFSHGYAKLPFEKGEGEKITDMQAERQQTFNNWQTTDDHLMHLTGLAHDKNGTNFFLTKNSWGEDRNDFGGYLYMSEPYIKLKTVAIMIHKDALPKKIKKKLGL